MNKGGYEQEQGALWLVEVGHHGLHDLVVISRCDDDLRAGVQSFHLMPVQVVEQGLQGVRGRDGGFLRRKLVGLPLAYVQFFFRGVGVLHYGKPDVVEALQGAYRGGAHGNGLSVVCQQLGDGVAGNGDVLCMHFVPLNLFALDRLEGACAHVQGQFF